MKIKNNNKPRMENVVLIQVLMKFELINLSRRQVAFQNSKYAYPAIWSLEIYCLKISFINGKLLIYKSFN